MTAFFTENDNLDKIENDCITSYSTECKIALAFCTAGIFLLSIIFIVCHYPSGFASVNSTLEILTSEKLNTRCSMF
jgi:hypothetical protein